MACNCKRARNFEEKYGIPQEETISARIIRYFFKVFFFISAILIAIIVIPYIMCYAVYSIFFGDNKITLPKFLRKYLE